MRNFINHSHRRCIMRIEGIVVHGRRLGHALGFPTANIAPERIAGDGPDGVYAAWFSLEGELKKLPCMLNIGAHPTLPGGGRSFEAHIFGFDGELYGRRATVETVEYLRGERRFPGPEALREQLEADRLRCLDILHIDTSRGIG